MVAALSTPLSVNVPVGDEYSNSVHPNITFRKVIKHKKVAPNKKTLFVSRLNLLTTSADVLSRIGSCLTSNNLNHASELVKCKKNTSSGSMVASFKITVSEKLFNILISPRVWPTNTFVQEFVKRRRNIRYSHRANSIPSILDLPLVESAIPPTNSKNSIPFTIKM